MSVFSDRELAYNAELDTIGIGGRGR